MLQSRFESGREAGLFFHQHPFIIANKSQSRDWPILRVKRRMASKLPTLRDVRARMMRILRPATKWGRATLWLGILSLVLWGATLSGASLEGWAVFTTLVFAFVAIVVLCRWGLRPLLWRLRNRLIVTYLFIGVMPILLLLLMGGVAGYFFAGQFAIYVVFSDLHSELQHLQAANDSLAAQLFPLESGGRLNEKIAGEFTRASDERFPGRTVTVSSRKKATFSPPAESCFPSRRRRCPISSVQTLPVRR